MKVSIKKFTEHIKTIDRFFYQHTIHDEIDHLYGILEFNHKGCFPIYDVVNDKWYSYEEDEDCWREYEMEFNYHADGKFDFGILGEAEHYSSFYLYNPIELKQFISIVNRLPKTEILNFPYLSREFKMSDVIKKLYVTIKDSTGRIKLCDLNILKEKLPNDDFRSLLKEIFSGDFDFLVNIGNWNNYCEEHNIPTLDEYYGNISLLYNCSFINVTDPYINFAIPYLAFELSPDFSSQYFCDMMFYSNDGKKFIDSLMNSIIEGKPLMTMSIAAPKDFISQLLYSSAFRLQYNYYLQVSNSPNFRDEQMIDLKSICVNLRENFQEYFFNKEKTNFLDIEAV